MRRILSSVVLLLAVAGVAWGQSDVQVSSTQGKTITLGRGLVWNQSGSGGFNNAFIVTSNDVQPSSYCLYITNNDVSSNTPLVSIYYSGDPTVNKYYGNTGKWIQSQTATNFTTIAAGTTASYSIGQPAANKLSIVLSNGGTSGTADVFMVKSTNGVGCPGNLSFIQGLYNISNGNIGSNLFTQFPLGTALGSITAIQPKSAMLPLQLVNNQIAFFASCYNPNASVVFCYLGPSSLTNPLTSVSLVAVSATSFSVFPIPARGVYLAGGFYAGCSTSVTSLVDPASNCTIQVGSITGSYMVPQVAQ